MGLPHHLTTSDYMNFPNIEPDFSYKYGEEHGDQYGELYLPKDNSKPLPVVVMIHGGCWQSEYGLRPVSHTCDSLRYVGSCASYSPNNSATSFNYIFYEFYERAIGNTGSPSGRSSTVALETAEAGQPHSSTLRTALTTCAALNRSTVWTSLRSLPPVTRQAGTWRLGQLRASSSQR
jgi:hypothetical protein